MNNETNDSPQEYSEAVQDLRDEMRRDVRGLAEAIERRPNPKPGVSPLALVAGVLGALFVGAAGMSWYDSSFESQAESAAGPVDIQAELKTAMTPYTQRLEQVSRSLESAQQVAADDSKEHGLLLDRVAETVTSLEQAAEAQTATFHERIDLLGDELAAKLTSGSNAVGGPTIAARPPIPDRPESAVQPAIAEDEVNDADDGLVEVEKRPAAPAASEPERGELVINNPSEYDLKLLINGQPMDIKARGATTVDIAVGKVTTQIASLPELTQDWNNWETVDGVKRLTINVVSSDGYYKLK
ncbi:MAG: hypothetical protein WD070_10745 [Pirellulaceae bacterium]